MTRDAFVIALIAVVDRNLSTRCSHEAARQAIGDVFRQYLNGLGCTPTMIDWATEQIQTRYRDETVSVQSAFSVADELERMVRA